MLAALIEDKSVRKPMELATPGPSVTRPSPDSSAQGLREATTLMPQMDWGRVT